MTKPSITQSQKRFHESLASLFIPLKDFSGAKNSLLFLKSSTDEGVIRNSGRNGARFAPQSLLSYFKRLTQTDKLKNYQFTEAEVASREEEIKNFHDSQLIEAKKISEILNKFPDIHIYHLGGGHDHVFPLLTALGEKYKKVIVINIDAHADTRDDENFHSGTPFRQFAQNYSGEFHLFQLGLHPFANSFSTLSPLGKGSHEIIWRNDLHDTQKLEASFRKIQKLINKDSVVVFSLDADALEANAVPGVSAVNGDGLTVIELNLIWEKYLALPLPHKPIIGLYELNPQFDTLSMTSMRTLGNFLFNTIS